jgi:hypothetical protein
LEGHTNTHTHTDNRHAYIFPIEDKRDGSGTVERGNLASERSAKEEHAPTA